jgi:hypothetical protein
MGFTLDALKMDASMTVSFMMLVATLVLAVVTVWYAVSTHRMLKAMQAQSESMKEQSKAMQKQHHLMLKSTQVSAWCGLMTRWALQVTTMGHAIRHEVDPSEKLRQLAKELEELEETQTERE